MVLASVRRPGVGPAVYALDLLESIEHVALPSALSDALAHPVPEVRQDMLARIERLRLVELLPAVKECPLAESAMAVRGACLRTLAMLVPSAEVAPIVAQVNDVQPDVKAGVLVGLL